MRTWTPLLFILCLPGLRAQVATPATAPATATASQSALSFIAAPIKIDLAPILAGAERATPRVPPGVETWINLPGSSVGNPAYRYNLYRDNLMFAVNGKRLAIHTTVNYWMEVGLRMKDWVKGMGACGRAPEPFRRARLGLVAELGLTPDWGLDLKLIPEEPLRIDSCEVTFLGHDITDKVLGGMKDAMAKAAQNMEQQLKTSTLLRQRAEAAWLQAQQPMELGPDLTLLLNPEKIRLAPWTSQGKEITITPEIQVRPTLTLGPRPVVAPLPLPALDLSPGAIQPGFHLRVEASLGFEQATAQLARQMVGKRFETDKGVFEVLSVAVHAQADKALLEIGLKGRINGKLSLIGKPVFDPASGRLQLEGLDYTLESKNWITKLGEWIYRSTLRATLADKCNWFVDESFKNLRNQAQQGLNRNLNPNLAMNGTIDSFSLDRIDVLPDQFRVVALLNGQMQITVKTGF